MSSGNETDETNANQSQVQIQIKQSKRRKLITRMEQSSGCKYGR